MSTKTKTILRQILIVVSSLFILVFLLGPIAGFDVPSIAKTIQAQPVQLVQFLIVGIANGAIVAIIALGYTMVYGIIELINFAHGDVYMFGVFSSLTILISYWNSYHQGPHSYHMGNSACPGGCHYLLCCYQCVS